MVTFLIYVMEQVLGPADAIRADGKASWECPNCGADCFSTRPHKEGMKDRFSCFKCRYFGDEWDILGLIRPKPSKRRRAELLRELRREYQKLHGPIAQGGRGVSRELVQMLARIGSRDIKPLSPNGEDGEKP